MMLILWRQPIQGYEPNLGAAAASGSLVVSSLTKRNGDYYTHWLL